MSLLIHAKTGPSKTDGSFRCNLLIDDATDRAWAHVKVLKLQELRLFVFSV